MSTISEPKQANLDAVPGNDKAHAHSHAAHLHENGNASMSGIGIGKQGREPGAIQQPPQDPRRNGKTNHRD
ncbi:MAG: hypothetical protein V4734_02365 [Terriglobus sp.]